jgi:hypothetical protein
MEAGAGSTRLTYGIFARAANACLPCPLLFPSLTAVGFFSMAAVIFFFDDPLDYEWISG